ncbi:hypothetical protein niasHS_010499 [Heterodera schachtii]|uniref:Integrase zinc-binding domain-containing protein n=1 Tax=Heterodera schachtii TaxID=97005 RepID=A0ABD2IWY4_HETSC
MDIIPFYYENGQLEALSSAHQWLKQSEMAGPTCSIWSTGLNEAIARERFARDASLTVPRNNSGHAQLALEMAVPPGGILVPHHLWQQQRQRHQMQQQQLQQQRQQQQQQQKQQQQKQQIRQSVKNNIVTKINRRRKAAIIARCAGGGTEADVILMTALSTANANGGSTIGPPQPQAQPTIGAVPSGNSTNQFPKPTKQRTPTTAKKTIAAVKEPSPNPRGATTDISESDEESDVEVFEVDEKEFGNDDLFEKLNRLEERKHHDDDPKVAQWRQNFEKAITERYRNKCRRRNMLCRRMLEFNLQRLKATENIELNQLLLTDLRIREKYAVTIEKGSEQIMLTHRESGRVFVCLEDMFDVLSKFHTDHGHGGSRKAMYVEARKRFANVSKEIVREFLKGCDHCAVGREGNGWGGRRVKGTGRGAAAVRTTARGGGAAPSRTTEIVGGLALRQYMEQIEEQQQNQLQQNRTQQHQRNI